MGDWPAMNRRRGDLIDKQIGGTLTADEQGELARLQGYADAHIEPFIAARLEVLEVLELSPCPFCAGQGLHDKSLRDGCQDGEPDAYAHFIRCRSCAAQGPWAKSQGNAARLWNMRVNQANQTGRSK